MALVPGINYELLYKGKDITKDVSDTLMELTYTDNVTGKADEVELIFDDTKKLWQNEWYPKKGDVISVQIGENGVMLPCGDFEIDETSQKNPPLTFTIKAISSAITKNIRTKNYVVHEGKTLKQIAQFICDKHGFTLDEGTTVVTSTKSTAAYIDRIDEIKEAFKDATTLNTTNEQVAVMQKLAPKVGLLVKDLKNDSLPNQASKIQEGFIWTNSHISSAGFNYYINRLTQVQTSLSTYRPKPTKKIVANNLSAITINRDTQADQTDLSYLTEISQRYGFNFSIKGNTMIFYKVGTLEDRPYSVSFTYSDLSSVDITTKTIGVYKSATVTHHDWENQEILSASSNLQQVADTEGIPSSESSAEDVLEIKTRIENKQQAEAIAAAELNNKNKTACSGSISGQFNLQCCAGNNIKLYGMGEDSGIFHITSSTFTLSKSGGNTFTAEINRVGFVAANEKKLSV